MLKKSRLPLLLAAMLIMALALTGCTVSPVSNESISPAQTTAATDATDAPVPAAEATEAPTVASTAPAEVTAAPTVASTTSAKVTAAPTVASTAPAEATAGLTIPIAELDGNAHFYQKEMDGVKVEVIAVKLPDGSIRTAFNACQVCYDSGRGYFKQEGDQLVCQNCGNRYTMDQLGLSAGGCNPAPIREADRSSDATTITISQDVLKTGEALFEFRKD